MKIRINEELDWQSILDDASIALAEAYMDNDIELEGDMQKLLTSVFSKSGSFLQNNKFRGVFHKKHSKKSDSQDIQHHYDIGNDFYSLWLDDSMTYSCAYFKNEDDYLEKAQRQKADHIFNKLRLDGHDRLLDIGCGWGQLIIKAAQDYDGLEATGCTLSHEQYEYVKERIEEEGLRDRVEVRLLDYRDLIDEGHKYSKIISVAMLEHVGKDGIENYFENVYDLLDDKGLGLIHSITGYRDPDDNSKGTNGFLNKYIFPGGYIPSISEIVYGINKSSLKLIDLESLRRHYQLTLENWSKRFHENYDQVIDMYDERFARMWDIFLQGCAAVFESGQVDVNQYLLEKGTDNTMPLTREYIL